MQSTWPLVGRDDPCGIVQSVLRGDGSPALLVRGPAGIGKSRLVAEVIGSSPEIWVVRASAALRTAPLAAFALAVPDVVVGAPDRRSMVGAVIDAVQARPPKAIWVDDVHHLDVEGSVVLYHVAERRLAPMVLTARDGEPLPSGVESLLALDGSGELAIGPLEGGDVERLLTDVLDGPVSRLTLRRLVERCGGNPLLLRELVRAGLADGSLVRRADLWHYSQARKGGSALEDLVADHALGVGQAAAEAFRHVAVADHLPIDAAERLAGAGPLRELVDAGLVTLTERQGRPALVRPAHPLFAEVVVGRMTAPEVRSTSAALAEAVEACGPDPVEEIRIVRWSLDAGVPVDAPRLLAASWSALSVFDLDLAVRAAEAARDAGDSTAVLPLATALLFAGRHEDAAPVFDRAVEVADGDWPRAMTGLTRTLNGAYIDGFGPWVAEAHRDLAASLDDEDMIGLLRSEEASALAFAGQLDAAVDLAAPFVTDPAVEPLVALPYVPGWAAARTAQGRTAEVIESLERLEREVPPVPGRARAWLFAFRSHAELVAGNFAEAEAAIARFDDLAYLAMVEDVAAVLSTEMRGFICLWSGDILGALRWLGEAVALSEVPESRFRRVIPWSYLAQARAISGDADGADAAAREAALAAEVFPLGAGYSHQAAAWARYAAGDVTGAARSAGDAVSWCAERGLTAAALWCAADSLRFAPSTAAGSRVLQVAAKVDGMWAGAFAVHAAAVVSRDTSGLVDAADRYEAIGAHLHAAEVLGLAADQFRADGRRDPASRARARSGSALGRCSGVVPVRAAAATGIVVASLTAREHEAASLAGGGLSNAEIAQRLGLSTRTVEGHLARAMAKLDVTRRAEIAAAMGPGLADA